MNTRTTLLAVLVITGLSAAVLPVAAHHSFSAFNTTETKTVTGTVRNLEWTNPHIWLWLNVPNDKGGVDVYGFEGMSPNFLERRGWTKSTLKVGDKVITTSGIYGQITRLNEKSVQIQIADKVRIEVARSAVGGYQGQDPVVADSGNA